MIKKGLKVKIIAGKDKNKEGEVIEIDRFNFRAKILLSRFHLKRKNFNFYWLFFSDFRRKKNRKYF